MTMFNQLISNLNQAKEYQIFVGWEDDFFNMLANVHEFGVAIKVTDKMRRFLAIRYKIHLKKSTEYIHIPPRAPREKTINKNQDKWIRAVDKLTQQYNYDMKKVTVALAFIIKKDYQAQLLSGQFKELSSATMHMRQIKGVVGNMPLYATGEWERRMVDKVAFK